MKSINLNKSIPLTIFFLIILFLQSGETSAQSYLDVDPNVLASDPVIKEELDRFEAESKKFKESESNAMTEEMQEDRVNAISEALDQFEQSAPEPEQPQDQDMPFEEELSDFPDDFPDQPADFPDEPAETETAKEDLKISDKKMPDEPAVVGAEDLGIDLSALGGSTEVTDKAAKPTSYVSELELFEDIPMVITASKKLQPLSEAPASVYVITQDDIKKSGSIHLYDILRQVPGMDVAATTTGQADISIRGFNDHVASKTLFLIDGVSIYSPVQGIQLQEVIPVPLEEIEQIEIVKGPVASLYGANANLGLINIITKKPGQINGTTFSATRGSHNTHRYALLHGGKHQGFSYKVSTEWKETDAVEKRPPANTTAPLEAENFTGLDALDVIKQNAQFDYAFDEDTSVSLQGGYTRSDIHFAFNDLKAINTVFGINPPGINTLLGPLSTYTSNMKGEYKTGNYLLKAYWVHFNTDFETEVFDTNLIGDSVDIENRYSFDLGSHYLILGGGGKYDQVNSDIFATTSTSPKSEKIKSQTNWNVYFQDDWKLTNTFRINASARLDNYTLSGNNFSWRIAPIYHPNPNDTYRLSAGYSFRNPTFSDYYLHQELTPRILLFGNPILFTNARALGDDQIKAERYETFEAGYTGRRMDGRLKIFGDFYWTKINRLINFDAAPFAIPQNIQFANIGDAYSTGFESGYEWKIFDDLIWESNYAFNKTYYRGSPAFETYFPEHKINSGLKLNLLNDKLTSKFQMHYVWPRDVKLVDTDFSTLGGASSAVSSYYIVNAWVGLKLTPNTEFSLSGFNILDNDHREINNGDRHGRRFLGKLEMKF